MIDQNCKAEQFRALHVRGNPLILFNIWDAGGAKAVADGGAKAIATSSWSVANANGFADGERIPLAEAIDNLRRIVCVTDLPVTADLEVTKLLRNDHLEGHGRLVRGTMIGCCAEQRDTI